MLAIECDNCGKTSYTADPQNKLPCPHCGVQPGLEVFGAMALAKSGTRPLNDLDRKPGEHQNDFHANG